MHVCVAIQIIPPALWAIGGLGVPIVPSTPLFPKIPWERGLPLPLPVEGRLGSFWTPVGIIFTALGTLGASLWSIWVPFWVPWGTFGHHGHHFVCLGHPLGIILIHLETILATLGSLWTSFWSLLGPLGRHLGTLGRHVSEIVVRSDCWPPFWSPKCIKNHQKWHLQKEQQVPNNYFSIAHILTQQNPDNSQFQIKDFLNKYVEKMLEINFKYLELK